MNLKSILLQRQIDSFLQMNFRFWNFK